jgi:hypothetical protein
MLTFANPILGFIEEVRKLDDPKFSIVLQNQTVNFRPGNYDLNSHDPLHSGSYDISHFESMANIFRKLIILDEPVSLKNVHKEAKSTLASGKYLVLSKKYSQIQNYLGRNINDVSPLKFSLPGSSLMNLRVRDGINDYFAAVIQHAKPELQRRIAEYNTLSNGNFSEMIRISCADIVQPLKEYSAMLVD